MTEERKQELRLLLQKAMLSLEIRYGYDRSLSISEIVHQRYLEERWKYHGVHFLSYMSLDYFTCDIDDGTAKSNLIDFIREEFSQFTNGDTIPTASCYIESHPTDGSCLCLVRYQRADLSLLIERLVEIANVRGIEEAVSVFDRFSCPEGAHGVFQDIAVLENIELKSEIPVFDGIRLVPLPSPKISEEFVQNCLGLSFYTFMERSHNFFSKTLLVIDRPGSSVFHNNASVLWSLGRRPVDDLPFRVGKHDERFPNFNAVNSFRRLFCQSLSLVCNAPVQIVDEGQFLAEDKSLIPYRETFEGISWPNPHGSSAKAGETDIEKAKCLYDILDRNSDVKERLQIPINRWIKSKTLEAPIDKIIDLGIAFEALYLSDVNEELTFRLGVRAAWYLGNDEKHRKELLKMFGDIYRCRSNAVHSGKLDETVRFGGERIPISKFVAKAQDLCRDSIMRILEKEKYPDWNSLILGGEVEQESSA